MWPSVLWPNKVGSAVLEGFSNLSNSRILWRGKELQEAFLSPCALGFAAIPGFFSLDFWRYPVASRFHPQPIFPLDLAESLLQPEFQINIAMFGNLPSGPPLSSRRNFGWRVTHHNPFPNSRNSQRRIRRGLWIPQNPSHSHPFGLQMDFPHFSPIFGFFWALGAP